MTAAGVFLGAQVPASWGLDFTLAVSFIGLVVPALRDRALVAAESHASDAGALRRAMERGSYSCVCRKSNGSRARVITSSFTRGVAP